MPRCAHCGERFFDLGHEVCPICSRPLRSRPAPADAARATTDDALDESDIDEIPHGPLTAIARFGNAAEAGYFAHELEQAARVPVRMTTEENFDALSGRWCTRFLLTVPDPLAQEAAIALQTLVDQSDEGTLPHDDSPAFVGASPGTDFLRPERSAASDSPINWMPIVLTLAASSAALWGMRKLNERPKVNVPVAPVGRQHVELWESLAAPQRPWELNHDGVEGTRQFWIDRQRNVAVIREDADGDGQFERELVLRPVPIRH